MRCEKMARHISAKDRVARQQCRVLPFRWECLSGLAAVVRRERRVVVKNVLETALEAEMTEHLGYDKHDPTGRTGGNSRNGTRSKTVLTEIGAAQIEVPRDTDSSSDPAIVRKRQRR